MVILRRIIINIDTNGFLIHNSPYGFLLCESLSTSITPVQGIFPGYKVRYQKSNTLPDGQLSLPDMVADVVKIEIVYRVHNGICV
ncbi:hypothetical protein [Methanospirillum sp.]|uniref:hypothetical protein n=1 Tax=Methanospirillum sp. TaxID=45200 RepID=UPI002CF20B59|nr:hypothetical protein [Methanospirillum sp.]HOL42349.1 hypothetical protein [Methanospirillum sp.]HPP77994.1 hypothetical protein [Methanospirillum sp.]